MTTVDESRKRDKVYIQAAQSFRRFTGEETLLFGLRLSSISLRILHDLVNRIAKDETIS